MNISALNPKEVALAFVIARANDTELKTFPNDLLPPDLASAYQCQNQAIAAWPDTVGGWKVGQIPMGLREKVKCDRLAGPIFSSTIAHGDGLTVPICRNGFAAVEAEYVALINEDSPAGKIHWTLEEAQAAVGSLHIGIEIASCPLKTVNDLGPTAVIAAFGNNFGLVVGPEIEGWADRAMESLKSSGFIDGKKVGEGGAFNLTGGILRSVQFALEQAAQNGHPMQAGSYIATGQTNGIHDITSGQKAHFSFGDDGELCCYIEA